MAEFGRSKVSKLDLDDPLYFDMCLSAWETRGWTFQEEHSSFRLLYFGRNMMHLACPAWNSSENGLLLSTGSVHHGPFHQLLDLAVTSKIDSDQQSDEAADDVPLWETPAFTVRQIWEHISLITQREFTYRQDIFPAIASLAKAAAKVQNDKYLAGLWEKTLHSGLLWCICQPKPGSLDTTIAKFRRDDNGHYIAPSWSWVGSEEYFEYLARPTYTVEEPDRSSEPADSSPFYRVGSRPSHLTSAITLLEPRIEHESASRYGRLKPGASLLIRGRLLRQFPGGGDIIQKPEGDGRPATAYFADCLGSICLDWSVLRETRQRAPERMVLLLTASCCQATSNEVLRWHANPDEEEHTLGLSDRAVHPDRADDDDGLSPNGGDSAGSSRREEAETCLSCLDEEGGQSKNAFGMVLYPDDKCEEGGRLRYFRVGIFVLFGYSGGLRLFEDASFYDVEIV
ncbi:hypothetical protein QBC43DRAFT_303796 [Cladorrhinum sp. PSN259]|nr:hypothetical protein QBC43DRAFT_303796 [Cladorrhinum sp. PSN259]